MTTNAFLMHAKFEGLPGQGRQPQRNIFNLKRNKSWLNNLTS